MLTIKGSARKSEDASMPILGDGQIFERYKTIRWLGSGTSGESYEAEDSVLLRKVTLKIVHPWSILSDAARRQFFREMQGISVLSHPYLAAVLDYGESDGHLYVTRRFVSSGSLLGNHGRTWFQPPLLVIDAFTYVDQLAQALQYIHQHGHLHGNLSFNNILVLRGPNIERTADHAPFLLADIGLTHLVRRFGKPQIETLPISAAPEQSGKRVTPASDQFALAVLLYFWLTGNLPYLGTPEEVEQLKLTETINPVSQLNPAITLEQDSLILRALAASPDERHPSVLAFTRALMASLSLDQTLATVATEQPERPRQIPTIPLTETSTEQVASPVVAEPAFQPALAEESASPAPRLLISSPYVNSPYEFLLEREETNVGRAGASDLLLDKDNLTSRHHALIKCEGERILIFDKRSNNGVFINGQKIAVEQGYELLDGDHISIGDYELVFRAQVGSPVSHAAIEPQQSASEV
jgi:serine/threonine protein kinase